MLRHCTALFRIAIGLRRAGADKEPVVPLHAALRMGLVHGSNAWPATLAAHSNVTLLSMIDAWVMNGCLRPSE